MWTLLRVSQDFPLPIFNLFKFCFLFYDIVEPLLKLWQQNFSFLVVFCAQWRWIESFVTLKFRYIWNLKSVFSLPKASQSDFENEFHYTILINIFSDFIGSKTDT